MKKLLFPTLLTLILCICNLHGAEAVDLTDPEINRAVDTALRDAVSAIKSAPFAGKTVSVIPLPSDKNGILAGKIKNLATAQGHVILEGQSDPMWQEIIKEISWSEQKDDILDQATIAKFGKLKGVQVLLYASVITVERNAERIYVQIALHATDIRTRQHIWGHSCAARLYTTPDFRGIISLDNNLRLLLKKNFDDALKSLKSPEFAAKLENTKNVTIIPLAGDIDGYLTGLAFETITHTGNLSARSTKVSTLSLFRDLNKNISTAKDAVLYGAVRDLRRKDEGSENTDDYKIKNKSTVYADIQLFIENVNTGDILWSKTITLSETVYETRQMTNKEMNSHTLSKFHTMVASMFSFMIDHIGYILAGLAVLVAIIFGIKIFVSHKYIR